MEVYLVAMYEYRVCRMFEVKFDGLVGDSLAVCVVDDCIMM